MQRRNEYVTGNCQTRAEIYKMAQATQKSRVNKESDDETTRSVDENFRKQWRGKGAGYG